ncbi:unnamed protein product, partial [Pylaiella littoralis]
FRFAFLVCYFCYYCLVCVCVCVCGAGAGAGPCAWLLAFPGYVVCGALLLLYQTMPTRAREKYMKCPQFS